jgi:hypothetical protein
MDGSGKMAAGVLTALAAGLALGSLAGRAALWWALGIAVVGMILLLIGRRRATSPGAGPESSAQPGGAGLSGLGTRVDQILRQAEQQATGHEQRSRQAADDIIAAARAEAQSIIDQARAQAAAITGPPDDATP